MADDTAAALVIQLSADFKNFQKEMRAATGVFDAEGRKIEARQKKLRSNLQEGFSGVGKYLIGGAALYGLKEFVSRVVDAGSKIKDTADAIGIGTNELQSWGALAGEAGVDQETFNAALEKFSKTLGDAAVKGGPALKLFRELGVNVKGDTTQAFYQFADAVAKTREGQQRTALVTDVFGKKMANLVPVIAQGSAALKKQTADMAASGKIMTTESIDKLDALGDAWDGLTRQITAIGGNALADPLKHLTDTLKDPDVQSGMREFAKLLGEVAAATIKAARYAPALAGAYAGFRIGRFAGPVGGAIGAVGGAVVGQSLQGPDESSVRFRLKHAQDLAAKDPVVAKNLARSIAQMQAQVAGFDAAKAAAASAKSAGPGGGHGGIDRGDLLGVDATKRLEGLKELQALSISGEKAVREATLGANQDIRQDSLDTQSARIADVKAQDDALLQLAQGTSDYYDLQKKVIVEIAALDIQEIEARKDAELKGIAERSAAQDAEFAEERRQRKVHLDELVLAEKITRTQAIKSMAEFDAATDAQKAERDKGNASHSVALEQETASQITAINAKKNADLSQSDEDQYQVKARAIELNNTLRTGVEDIAVAGLHGFRSMKDAAASFMETIAATILRLYVMKPLLDSLFGAAGTAGGGLVGSLLGVPGFASGTNSAPGGMALVGEHGPELVNLPRGAQVIPNVRAGFGGMTVTPIFNIDARYATRGVAEEITAQLRAAAPQIVSAAVQRSDARTAANMRKANRDTF